jgi:LPS export ABC transporter protein LptC
MFSDSGRLQMKMFGEEILLYDTGDQIQEFPKGTSATFYDEFGKVTVVVTADEATNFRGKKLLNLRKNVVIRNFEEKTTTYTEDFYWDQDKRRLYSNVYTKQVSDNGDVTEGSGFDSDEQMKDFVIRNAHIRHTISD